MPASARCWSGKVDQADARDRGVEGALRAGCRAARRRARACRRWRGPPGARPRARSAGSRARCRSRARGPCGPARRAAASVCSPAPAATSSTRAPGPTPAMSSIASVAGPSHAPAAAPSDPTLRRRASHCARVVCLNLSGSNAAGASIVCSHGCHLLSGATRCASWRPS